MTTTKIHAICRQMNVAYQRGETCQLIIQNEQNSAAIASMIDWWRNWTNAIAGLKHPRIDIAATKLPLAEAVAVPESVLSALRIQDNIIGQDCAYRHKANRNSPPWQLSGNDQTGA